MSGSLYFAGFFRLSVRFSGKIQNSWLWVCVFCFDCFSVLFWLVAISVQNPWLLLLMLLICEMGILELICVQLNN